MQKLFKQKGWQAELVGNTAETLRCNLRLIAQAKVKQGSSPPTWLKLIFEDGPIESFAEGSAKEGEEIGEYDDG